MEEGEVAGEDEIALEKRSEHGLRVAEVTDLFVDKTPDAASLQCAAECAALSESWRGYFEKRLKKHGAGGEGGQ